jgi:hypothetical protein
METPSNLAYLAPIQQALFTLLIYYTPFQAKSQLSLFDNHKILI